MTIKSSVTIPTMESKYKVMTINAPEIVDIFGSTGLQKTPTPPPHWAPVTRAPNINISDEKKQVLENEFPQKHFLAIGIIIYKMKLDNF